MKGHWENIYSTKQPNQMSWTQKIPEISLKLIKTFKISKTANIIDVGGGQSTLIDFLLASGYKNISVLDISKNAIMQAKNRLGEKAKKVNWIESNIIDFKSSETYDLCHDRAAFHFLTNKEDIDKYLKNISKFSKRLIIGTFSNEGPKKCSGLDIKQYDENSMKQTFEKVGFKSISFSRSDHNTPSNAIQKFIFGAFEKDL